VYKVSSQATPPFAASGAPQKEGLTLPDKYDQVSARYITKESHPIRQTSTHPLWITKTPMCGAQAPLSSIEGYCPQKTSYHLTHEKKIAHVIPTKTPAPIIARK